MSTRTLSKVLASGSGVVTGTYTGDGNATQAIVGVGFQPKEVMIYPQKNLTQDGPAFKTDRDGINAMVLDYVARLQQYWSDQIISLDADGFTVGDGTATRNMYNVLGIVYTYVCWR